MFVCSTRWQSVVERAAWVAQSLAALPIEKEEDALTLVFHINRQVRAPLARVVVRGPIQYGAIQPI